MSFSAECENSLFEVTIVAFRYLFFEDFLE